MRKLLSTAAVLLALAAPAFAQNVRIGVEGNYPPFSMIAPDGKLSGFDIDIANAVCAEMKTACTLVQRLDDYNGGAQEERRLL
jgi:ABC-type amino acid transport substrate-binding protein